MRATYEDDDSEPTGREQQVDPVLNLANLDVVPWRDNTSLVQAAVQLDDNLS